MAKGRDNVAESLGDITELLRQRRQSGLLSVERMQGGRFEEGEIYFRQGQPTYAHTGQMLGQEALIWMLSWHKVYFSFLLDEPFPPTNIFAPSFNENVAVSAPISNSSLLNANRTSAVTSTSPRLPQISARNATNEASIREASAAPPAVNSSTPGLEWLVPQKLGRDQDVLALPLTRPQRSIYLLVDGKRTIADLSRCTRKSLQEIERLLSELQERGLIAI